MVKRRGDKTPTPPGGRAAERLRMFENARRVPVPAKIKKSKKPKKPAKSPHKGGSAKKGGPSDEEQEGHQD